MDSVLVRLVDYVNSGGNVGLSLHILTDSGVSFTGFPRAHTEFRNISQPALIELVGESVLRTQGEGDAAALGAQWAQDIGPAWDLLSEGSEETVLTLVSVKIQAPGFNEAAIPVVRLDCEHIAAWWLLPAGPLGGAS